MYEKIYVKAPTAVGTDRELYDDPHNAAGGGV